MNHRTFVIRVCVHSLSTKNKVHGYTYLYQKQKIKMKEKNAYIANLVK